MGTLKLQRVGHVIVPARPQFKPKAVNKRPLHLGSQILLCAFLSYVDKKEIHCNKDPAIVCLLRGLERDLLNRKINDVNTRSNSYLTDTWKKVYGVNLEEAPLS